MIKTIDDWNNMSYERFLDNLGKLDWFYGMSDDPRVYREGSQDLRDYRELAEANGPEWVASFDKEQEKHRITS